VVLNFVESVAKAANFLNVCVAVPLSLIEDENSSRTIVKGTS
jgi:hypothetical protein